METKTLKLTIRVDYTTSDNKQTPSADLEDYVNAIICERANAFNHTIEDGIKIKNVELFNE